MFQGLFYLQGQRLQAVFLFLPSLFNQSFKNMCCLLCERHTSFSCKPEPRRVQPCPQVTMAVTELCLSSFGKSGWQVKLTEGGKMGRRHWSWDTRTMCMFMRKECEWRVVVLTGRAYESKEVRRGRPWYWQSQQNQRTNDWQTWDQLVNLQVNIH